MSDVLPKVNLVCYREEATEFIHERAVEIVMVNLSKNVTWQLLDYVGFFIIIESIIFVVLPSEIHMSFDILFEFLLDRLSIVEKLKKSEKLAQVIALISCFVDHLDLVKDLNEVAHDVRENGNSEKQDERNQKSLLVTLWVEITKAYR